MEKNEIQITIKLNKRDFNILNKYDFDFERNIQDYISEMARRLKLAIKEYNKGMNKIFEDAIKEDKEIN